MDSDEGSDEDSDEDSDSDSDEAGSKRSRISPAILVNHLVVLVKHLNDSNVYGQT
jgi:hypothetical protein